MMMSVQRFLFPLKRGAHNLMLLQRPLSTVVVGPKIRNPHGLNINCFYKQVKEVELCRKCGFKTSPKRDAVPPAVLVLLSRIAKVGAMLVGRGFRRWWAKLTPEDRAKYALRAGRNRYVISGNKLTNFEFD
jgi:hypothetical protein